MIFECFGVIIPTGGWRVRVVCLLVCFSYDRRFIPSWRLFNLKPVTRSRVPTGVGLNFLHLLLHSVTATAVVAADCRYLGVNWKLQQLKFPLQRATSSKMGNINFQVLWMARIVACAGGCKRERGDLGEKKILKKAKGRSLVDPFRDGAAITLMIVYFIFFSLRLCVCVCVFVFYFVFAHTLSPIYIIVIGKKCDEVLMSMSGRLDFFVWKLLITLV